MKILLSLLLLISIGCTTFDATVRLPDQGIESTVHYTYPMWQEKYFTFDPKTGLISFASKSDPLVKSIELAGQALKKVP